jgi:hypothetical protein
MVVAMRLSFDDAGHLVIDHGSGRLARVANPFVTSEADRLIHADSLLGGMYRLAGGRIQAEADAAPRISIDFHAPNQGWLVHRWDIDPDGGYIGQQPVELGTTPPAVGTPLVNGRFLDVMRQSFNDQRLYDFLRLTFGRDAAVEFIDAMAADHAVGPADCRLVVIFNHHYGRNCRPLHDLYRRRFPAIDFVLPGPAPRHPNYHSFPFGSYQFHGLVHGYLAARDHRDCRAYLFIHDDVLLHPSLTAARLLALLGPGHGGIFHRRFHRRTPLPADKSRWLWAPRTERSIREQNDPLYGNGFEGLTPAVPLRRLFNGVSDCFALAGGMADEFTATLAPLVAANVFPETAIPTALFQAADRTGMPIAIHPITIMRPADGNRLDEPGFVDRFLASDSLCLHPVKLAHPQPAVTRLLEAVECRTENGTSPTPATRFCIVTTGRTGSTRLRLLLDSHPRILCHGELFGENLTTLAAAESEMHRLLVAERAADPAAFLTRRAFAAADAGAVGFKILYGQLLTRWPGLLEALRSDRDVRIIHLVRRNGIKRFLSEYFVGTVTHRHLCRQDETPPAVAPVTIPVATLLADLEQVGRHVALIRDLFRDHPCHEVAYEDSLDDNGPAMQGVQAFLGVPPAPLSVPIRKILPDDPRRLIANFDEVAAAVRGTPFEPMLTDRS